MTMRAYFCGWLVMPLLPLLATACSTLAFTVDGDLLQEVSLESKIMLFDAENDVSIAIDELDQIQRDIREIKQDIRDAQEQVAEAESDAARASGKDDDEAELLGETAAEVFELKIDYLMGELDYLGEKREIQDNLIDVAKAKFELAKAKLVKKNNVRGVEDIEIEDYEAQVDYYVEVAQMDQEWLAELATEVEGIKTFWLEERTKLQEASGGALGSPWAEDSALWGRR